MCSLPPTSFAVALYPQAMTVGEKNDGAVFVGAANFGSDFQKAVNDLRAGMAEGIVRADGKDGPSGAHGSDKIGRTRRIGAVVADLEHRTLERALFLQ